MKTNKKIISIVLSVILVISLTTTVLISTANAKRISIIITTDKQELTPGESATVSVKVTANCTLATMSIPVFYDKTLVDVSEATPTLTDYTVKNAVTDSESANSSKVYANTGISSDNYGFVLVNYIGSAGAELAENTDAVVLTFKITAKSNVNGTAVVQCVEESAKTESNIAGMLYFGSMPSGKTIDAIPENVENITLTNATTSVKISDGRNTLALKEDAPFEAVIDTTNCGDYNGTIYGFDTLGWNDAFEVDGAIADFITTTYGDDYLEVVVGDAGVETTGTLINVLDENGDVVETYVYIYFGDVDMDGLVGASDAAICEYYELNYEGVDTFEQFMAADIDGDCWPGAGDAAIMEYYELYYEGMPTQAELGEINVNNYYEMA